MVRLRFDTDLGSSISAVNDFNKAVDKLGDNFEVTAGEAKKLERAAGNIVKANEGPQERYNRKVAELAKQYKAGKISIEDAEKAAARFHQTMMKAGQAQDQSFGAKAAANVASFLTGIVSVNTAVQIYRSEMEAIKAEAEKVAQSQLTAAGARDKLKRNIAPMGADRARKIEASATALSVETGVSQQYIDVALADAVSSSDNEEQAINRVRVAAGFLKTRPEGIGTLAGSLGDISKATKDQDDLRNLGFLISVSGKSRVADDQKFGDTFPVAAANMATYGATAEEAGALFDALGVGIADSEGRITGTAAIQLAAQLKDRVKGNTFGERLQALRDNPRLAEGFIKDASFESKAEGKMQEFLRDSNSPIARQYKELKNSFGTTGEQQALAKATAAYMDEGPLAKAAAIDRTIGANTESYRLTQDGVLTNEKREEIIERNRQLTGNLASANRFATFLSTGPTMSPQEAISELETGLRIGGAREDTSAFGVEKPSQELLDKTQQMIDELKRLNQQSAPKPSGRQE